MSVKVLNLKAQELIPRLPAFNHLGVRCRMEHQRSVFSEDWDQVMCCLIWFRGEDSPAGFNDGLQPLRIFL